MYLEAFRNCTVPGTSTIGIMRGQLTDRYLYRTSTMRRRIKRLTKSVPWPRMRRTNGD